MALSLPLPSQQPAPSFKNTVPWQRADASRSQFLWPGVTSLLLLVSAALATTPLRDAVSGDNTTHARLALSPAFLILAPLCNFLDALTLLSAQQHYAVFATLLGSAALCGMMRVRRHPGRLGTIRRIESGGVGLVLGLALFLVLYFGGALIPRPMAALRLTNEDELAIDFHSHTSASKDNRTGFSAESNRRWHASAGFHAAYITDHRSFDGVLAGMAGNPLIAGDGLVLLSGIETTFEGEHVNVLGAAPADSSHYRRNRLSISAYNAEWPNDPGNPFVLLTIPAAVSALSPPVDLSAVELSSASPRGIGFALRNRTAILSLADSHDLSVVAGSNNHGWGRTAAAWSVMRIPGWRRLSPRELDASIRKTIRVSGRDAVVVVERRAMAAGDYSAPLALTVPRLLWTMLTTLTWPERFAWIGWTWGLYAVLRLRKAARARPGGSAIPLFRVR